MGGFFVEGRAFADAIRTACAPIACGNTARIFGAMCRFRGLCIYRKKESFEHTAC